MSIMKKLSRLLLIGLLHSTIYLWILPNVIIPRVSGQNILTASVITSSVSIVLTISIVRFPALQRLFRKMKDSGKRKKAIGQN